MRTPVWRLTVRTPSFYIFLAQDLSFVLRILGSICVFLIYLSIANYGNGLGLAEPNEPIGSFGSAKDLQAQQEDLAAGVPVRQLHQKNRTENLLAPKQRETVERLQSRILTVLSVASSEGRSSSAFSRYGLWAGKSTPLTAELAQDYAFFYSLQKSDLLQKAQVVNGEQAYGVLLQPQLGRSYEDGKRAFILGDYRLASDIIIENRYTDAGSEDPMYLNWLLKSLLASQRLELIPRYLKQYRLQRNVLRQSNEERDAELYYLIGRYYFAIGDIRLARKIFIDYLKQFPGSYYAANSYYWIARIMEKQNYLEEARALYLLVVSYYSQHYLEGLAKLKAGTISLYLLKNRAEEFLRSRGVDW